MIKSGPGCAGHRPVPGRCIEFAMAVMARKRGGAGGIARHESELVTRF